MGGGGRCVRSSAQARGGGGGHVGAGGPGAAGDPSGLGQPRVHRGDHQLHQEDRGLSQLLRHVVPVPAGHPEREVDGAGAQDRVHRGPGHQRRDADVGLGRPQAPLSPPEHRRPAPRSGPAAASACVANKPLCSCPACSLPACLPGAGPWDARLPVIVLDVQSLPVRRSDPQGSAPWSSPHAGAVMGRGHAPGPGCCQYQEAPDQPLCSCWGHSRKCGDPNSLKGVSGFMCAHCRGCVGTAGSPGMVHMPQKCAHYWHLERSAYPSL